MSTAIIGFDRDIAEAIRAEIRAPANRVRVYDTLPDAYTEGGQFIIREGETRFHPDFIFYYSYFPDSLGFRKALAFSEVPTWPPVEKTILHDDKDLSLIQCVSHMKRWISYKPNPRGYVPGPKVRTGGEVIKCGNDHCGDNKVLVAPGELMDVEGPALLEPFIEGESYRSLHINVPHGKVGVYTGASHHRWAIHYESKDWRKNVGTTKKTVYSVEDTWLVPNMERIKGVMQVGSRLESAFRLQVAGIDFILPEGGGEPVLLEVNCYPEIPEEARETFISAAVRAYRVHHGGR